MTEQLDAAFAALSDRTRRDLIARLAVGDATVSELAAPYELTIQAISKHLNVLEAAGLVTKRPQAQRRLVHLEADALRTLTAWVDHYARLADQRYRRLDDVLAALREPLAAAPPEPKEPS